MSNEIYATINLSVSTEEVISTEDMIYNTKTSKVIVPTIVVAGSLDGIKERLHNIIDKLYITADAQIKLDTEEKTNE
jgi:hypothetical protein